MLKHVGLFEGSGIPSWCAQQAGFRTVAWCENDPWCANWLREYLPDAEAIEDIKTADWPAIAARIGRVDLLTGGFPCQPVSCAGKRKGEADERWLWPDMLRAIVGLRPAWVLAENVPGLRTKGADTVLGSLEAAGYSWRALVVGADDCGAMHKRKRIWIVAQLVHAQGDGRDQGRQSAGTGQGRSERACEALADATTRRQQGIGGARKAGASECRHVMPPGPEQYDWEAPRLIKPDVGGSAYGVAPRDFQRARKELLRTLGNGWHPTVPSSICRWIAGQVEGA